MEVMEHSDDRQREAERVRRFATRVARVREQVARLRDEQDAAASVADTCYAEYLRSAPSGAARRPSARSRPGHTAEGRRDAGPDGAGRHG